MIIEGVIFNDKRKAWLYFKNEDATQIIQTDELLYTNKAGARKLSQSLTPADILARVCFNIPLKHLINLLTWGWYIVILWCFISNF